MQHAAFVRRADQAGLRFAFEVRPRAFEGATEVTVLAPDHPRLLSVIAGACAASEANIAGAQIFTTADGRALDTVIVGRAFDDDADGAAPRRAARPADRADPGGEGSASPTRSPAGAPRAAGARPSRSSRRCG